MDAHEKWSYDTTQTPAVAKLEGIGFICKLCHAAEHIFLTMKFDVLGMADADRVIKHYCRVNRCKRRDFDRHYAEAGVRWTALSKIENWAIDYGEFAPLVAARDAAQKKWRAAQDKRQTNPGQKRR